MGSAPPTSDRTNHPFHTYDMIYEVPEAIKQTLLSISEKAHSTIEKVRERDRIYFTGCGTAFFAALLGSEILSLSRKLGLQSFPVPALELQSYEHFIDRSCAVIGVSHSGITKTTVDALAYAKRNGAFSTGITHFENRPISSVVDETLVVGNGPDNSRCHTKCYVASAIAISKIGIELLKNSADGKSKRLQLIESELSQLPKLTERVLSSVDEVCRRLAEEHAKINRCYFAGTGPNVPNTLEAALKIMETSFISAQGFETEQLLHGPWMSMDKGSLLFVLAPQGNGHQRNMDLVKAARTFETPVIGLIDEGDQETGELCDEAIELPTVDEYLSPFVNIIPIYLFAYYSSVSRGNNPDLIRYSTPAYWQARQIIFPPGTH